MKQLELINITDNGRWVRGRWINSEEKAISDGTKIDQRISIHKTISRRWETWFYISIFLIALIIRLWVLGDRAVHHDESLHGFFSWKLSNGEGYLHNPLTHGMFLFHSLAGIFFLFGDNDFTLRLPMALFGSMLVLIPLLLRDRIGQFGTISASVMLAFSPSMLYFSRFARNDIFMVVFALALVGVMFRYIDEQRARWLYAAAAILALGFTTKETQYITVFIIGVYLLYRTKSEFWDWLMGRKALRDVSPQAGFLVLLICLTIPMYSAGISVLQGGLPFTLAAGQNTGGIMVGAPSHGWGYTFAIIFTVFLVGIGWVLGLMWRPKIWIISWIIFAAVFSIIFTNYFTHIGGIGTGMWQSLGYWMGQQDVKRGSQPWYYYFILLFVYEFLPVLFSIGAAFIYGLKSNRKVGLFLIFSSIAFSIAGFLSIVRGYEYSDPNIWPFTVIGIVTLALFVLNIRTDGTRKFFLFWAIMNFAAFTLAGEKMPWLLVHLALPFIMFSAMVFNDLVTRMNWKLSFKNGTIYLVGIVPMILLLLWRLATTDFDMSVKGVVLLFVILSCLGALMLGKYLIGRRMGHGHAWASSVLVIGLVLFILTFRTGWIAAHVNSDVPREMLIYTQTSPDLHNLVQEINRVGELTGDRQDLNVSIDQTDGFAWPWQWYLRDFSSTGYPMLGETRVFPEEDVSIAIVNAKNAGEAEIAYQDGYIQGRRFVHRWWFPEDYRGLTPGKFFGTFIDRSKWHIAIDFFLYRKLPSPIGSVDSYVYFVDDIPVHFR